MARNAVLHPVGSEPPRVYWIRRGLLLVVILVIVLLLAHACGGGSGGARNSADRQHRPSVSPSATDTPTPQCAKTDVNVVARTDAETYPTGVEPQFSASVTNTSANDCKLRVAPASRVWTVTSGSDRVWTTADCASPSQGGGQQATKTLKVGHSFTYSVPWNRERSATGCPSPGAQAAPGTYVLTVTIAGKTSPPAPFHLTS